MNKTYLCGLLFGGAIAGGVAYYTNPTAQEKITKCYHQTKEIVISSWETLKKDMEATANLDIYQLRETALEIWHEKFPQFRERFRQLQEDMAPYMDDLKDLLIELKELLIKMQDQLRNLNKV
ncbi:MULTISPECIES: YtxH domain-containing protein [Bacillaceae]|uniref:Gas vesicle protein n=1 Tax=Evansella alkalicola TaxID=745819 RepID=A0ABS6JQ97_9BACI|nr:MULTISPECIES: YtxH domain-containing protein [Bacillaceae]MBU9720722.1 hypothetical protein [Bacillus alkalicola]